MVIRALLDEQCSRDPSDANSDLGISMNSYIPIYCLLDVNIRMALAYHHHLHIIIPSSAALRTTSCFLLTRERLAGFFFFFSISS